MRFHRTLLALSIIASAALPAAGLAQSLPAPEAATQTPAGPKGTDQAVAADPPVQSVPAPSRSVLTQAGDTRGASTGSSPPLARTAIDARGRAEVRAEAEQAVRNHRATLAQDLDLLDGR
jgi:hypothetical protein